MVKLTSPWPKHVVRTFQSVQILPLILNGPSEFFKNPGWNLFPRKAYYVKCVHLPVSNFLLLVANKSRCCPSGNRMAASVAIFIMSTNKFQKCVYQMFFFTRWKAFSFSVDLHGTHLNQSIHRRKIFYRFPARLWGWGVKIHLFVRRVGCKESKFIVIYFTSLNLLYDLNGQGRWMQSARMFTVCCPIY
jgi:hypothetical protein